MNGERAHIRRAVILSGVAWRAWCGARKVRGEEAARIEHATCIACLECLSASLAKGPPTRTRDERRAKTEIRLETLRRKRRKAREA